MKIISINFSLKTMLMLAALFGLDQAANSESFNFQTVPITTAIQNFAQMAQINYIIDPKLFLNSDGSLKPEPSLTIQWQCTAAEALARVAKENNLVIATNAFTTVVFITSTNHIANAVDANLLGSNTNTIIPMIVYEDVPLNIALSALIDQSHIKVVLAPDFSGEAPPSSSNFMPTVSIRWHNLTARQAIVELCEDYDLAIFEEANIVEIKRKK